MGDATPASFYLAFRVVSEIIRLNLAKTRRLHKRSYIFLRAGQDRSRSRGLSPLSRFISSYFSIVWSIPPAAKQLIADSCSFLRTRASRENRRRFITDATTYRIFFASSPGELLAHAELLPSAELILVWRHGIVRILPRVLVCAIYSAINFIIVCITARDTRYAVCRPKTKESRQLDL